MFGSLQYSVLPIGTFAGEWQVSSGVGGSFSIVEIVGVGKNVSVVVVFGPQMSHQVGEQVEIHFDVEVVLVEAILD